MQTFPTKNKKFVFFSFKRMPEKLVFRQYKKTKKVILIWLGMFVCKAPNPP
jgi:hypothetical protein